MFSLFAEKRLNMVCFGAAAAVRKWWWGWWT